MPHLFRNASRRSPLHKAFRVLTGLVAIGLIAWLLYLVPYDILREERFRLFGERHSSGVVLTAYEDEKAVPSERFAISYKFVDQDGYARTATAALPKDLWQLHQPGSRVQVFHPSGRPDLSRIPGEVEPAFQVWLRSVLD